MPSLVPAALRAMAVFEVFSREQRSLSNSELAASLNLPESSCSDLVHTLMTAGFLTRAPRTKKIYPSKKLLDISSLIGQGDSPYSSLMEGCEILREKTGETAIAGGVQNGVVQILAMREGIHALRHTTTELKKLSLHVSAIGRSILSMGSDEEAVAALQIKPRRMIAPSTVIDLEKLLAQIQEVRSTGYAFVQNEGGEGLGALAIAGDLGGEIVGISVSGPVERIKANLNRNLDCLMEVKKMIPLE